jgi:hypothetical protein
MHKQDHTTTDPGLQSIIESMYSEDCGKSHPFVARKGPEKNKKFKKHPLDKEKDEEFKPRKEAHDKQTAKCDHCNGTGNHGDKECKKCGGDGWIDAKDLKTGPKKNVEEAEDTGRIPHDVDSFGDKPRVGDEATGDPSTFQVGQILRSSQTGDGLDGIIIDISEEDGELSFHLMEIGEEGWTVRASDIKPSTRPRANW